MCGIFGAVLRHNIDVDVDVDAALHSLRHRGPDASGVWRDGPTTLGHTRLAILDLSPGGAQPMHSADRSVVVVFNGEVYNHFALRTELESLGHTFHSRADTEVIVEGYRAWGDAVVERLDGMFAIGIWDVARKRLLLARDRAGKKPLFYSTSAKELRFASEIKAIVASGHPSTIDSESMPFMLAFGYVPAPRTIYGGIAELPPASTLVYAQDAAPVVRRYWRAPFLEAPLRISIEDAIAEVRRLTDEAVRRRLEADVPLGAFLSGGIDSTVIVGLMARAAGPGVKTFSIGFTGQAAYDETRFARLAASRFGTQHTEFSLEPVRFDLIEQLVDLHDGPFGDSSAIPTSIVSKLTREHVTVALSGDGGDEIFCGYLRFLAAEAVEHVPHPLRRAAHALTQFLPSGGSERSIAARARRLLQSVDAPLAERLFRLSPLFSNHLDEVLRPELRSSQPLDWVSARLAQGAHASVLARILDDNFESYLPYDLLVKADRSSMMHSLEVRAPFLDRALIEFVARLPDNLKRRGTTTKWILRRAFADLIPEPIMSRGKMGFGVPLGAWFRGDLQGYLTEQLGPSSPIYEFVQSAFVSKMLADHLSGRADHGQRLWLLLTLAIWLRRR